jgi:insertion element IS1 protein InsB
MWSFVRHKGNDIWLWLAICRRTRQVVGYAVGKRTIETCRRLWHSIPVGYRCKHCFTDFWKAYFAVIPKEQHTACDKGDGETCYVERFNNTLRQRLGRLVRRTLSFSKCEWMHETSIRLFLWRYNIERRQAYLQKVRQP